MCFSNNARASRSCAVSISSVYVASPAYFMGAALRVDLMMATSSTALVLPRVCSATATS